MRWRVSQGRVPSTVAEPSPAFGSWDTERQSAHCSCCTPLRRAVYFSLTFLAATQLLRQGNFANGPSAPRPVDLAVRRTALETAPRLAWPLDLFSSLSSPPPLRLSPVPFASSLNPPLDQPTADSWDKDADLAPLRRFLRSSVGVESSGMNRREVRSAVLTVLDAHAALPHLCSGAVLRAAGGPGGGPGGGPKGGAAAALPVEGASPSQPTHSARLAELNATALVGAAQAAARRIDRKLPPPREALGFSDWPSGPPRPGSAAAAAWAARDAARCGGAIDRALEVVAAGLQVA